MADESMTEKFRELRESDIDEIVRWQMTGALVKRAPMMHRQPQPRCRHCGNDWHGLPLSSNGCQGSHLEKIDDMLDKSDAPITDCELG